MTTGSGVLVNGGSDSSSNAGVRTEANHHQPRQAGTDKSETAPMILANNNEADISTTIIITTTTSPADLSNGYVYKTRTHTHTPTRYACFMNGDAEKVSVM